MVGKVPPSERELETGTGSYISVLSLSFHFLCMLGFALLRLLLCSSVGMSPVEQQSLD